MSITIDGANNAIKDGSSNELISVTATGSAVNQIGIANAATGNGPVISAVGDDSNIDIVITPKGTGKIRPSAQILFNAAAPSFGRLALAMSDANTTLTNVQYNNRHLTFTGTLTAGRNIVVPLTDGAEWVIYNNTTGGFAVTVIGATGTGIAVAATKTAIVRCDGTNILRVTADV